MSSPAPHCVARAVGWFLVASAFVVLAVSVPVAVPGADGATLYRICHRTNAIKNPYRSIRVAWSALGPSDGTRHRLHDGIVFDVLDPEGTHANTPRDEVPGGGNERWGDIFSHTKGTTREHNWTTAGEAIFNGATFQLSDGVTRTACKSMSIQEYIDSEVDAGVPLEDVMDDLDDQESSEDLAVKNSLGGSFASWFASLPPSEQNLAGVNAGVSAATPTVTTNDAIDVTESSATLPGVSDPQGVSLTFRFEYSTDPALAGASTWDASMTVDGSPSTSSSASSSVNVASPLTGLSSGTTYYFELVGTNTSGSGDSEVSTDLRGGIKSFTTPVATTTTTTTTTSTSTTTTSTTTTTAAPATTSAPSPVTTASPVTTVPVTTGSSTTVPVLAPTTTVLARITPLECGTLDPRASSAPPTESIDVSLRETESSDTRKTGTVSLTQPDDGPAVELVEVTSSDPTVKVSVVYSGADYNKPSTWQDQGFGQECWKIEPFGDGDYRYLLPLTPQPPSGRTPSYYSLVKVKAGSITSTDPNFQVNTVFPTPAGGSVVFADSNGNGVSDAGGKNGDKSISHVIICVIYGEQPKQAIVPSTTTTSTTPSPTTSSSVVTSLAPSTTSVPTFEDCPTVPTVPTTIPSTPGTTVPGSSSTTIPGSSSTTMPGSSSTTVPGSSNTTVPGSSSTTVPGSSSTTVPGSTGTTIPGSSSTTVPGSSGTTIPGSSSTTTPGAPTTSTPTAVPGPLEKPMRFRVIVPKNSTAKVVTFNVKLSSGFRQYSMPLKIDVRTFKLRKEPLPVTGGQDTSPRLLAALLLFVGVAFLRAGKRLRPTGGARS